MDPYSVAAITSTLARSCPNTSRCISQVHCWRLSSQISSGAMAGSLLGCHPLFYQQSSQYDGRIQSKMTNQCQSLGELPAAFLRCKLNADTRLSDLYRQVCR